MLNTAVLCNLILLMILSCSESESNSSDTRGDDGGAVGTLPENVAVTGSLILGEETASGVGNLDSRQVELIDDAGDTIAAGITDASGAFSLQIGAAALSLRALPLVEGEATADGSAAPSASGTQIVRIKSLFQIEGSESDVVGLKKQILIDPDAVKVDSDGEATVDSGGHTAKKVGAIVGKINLETGENPLGIDVYIPGTTHIAKTDENGQYLLGFLPQGTFKLVAEKDSFNNLEWSAVKVAAKATTVIETAVLSIAHGPKIDQFSLTGLDEDAGVVTLNVKLSGASRYRISKLQDFSDAEFRVVNANMQEFSSTVSISAGVRVVSIYIEAVDGDGLTANSTITIDREAPLLGTIKINDSDGLTGNPQIPLILFAKNASKMRFAESIAALSTAPFVSYATSYTHTLFDNANADKTIYVEYADDAGNSSGHDGSISDEITFDSLAPDALNFALLTPATPTGAFNTPLGWTSTFEESVTFEVEVFSNANYTGNPLRTMTTTKTIVNTSPPLVSAGTYYWRVRAVDATGNSSDWLNSGSTRAFELKVLAESYQARREIKGTDQKDALLGRAMISVGDLNGDTYSEVAYGILGTETDDCADCGVVKIIDPITLEVLATLNEGLFKNERFGQKLTACDLDNDGNDELVVSAPRKWVRRGNYTYLNSGGIYSYNLQTFALQASYDAPIPAGDPPTGWYCQIDYNKNDGSYICGYEYGVDALDSYTTAGVGELDFGESMSCARYSGADHLIVGEPGYRESDNTVGRVHELSLAGSTFNSVEIIKDSPVVNWAGFGKAVVFLENFKWSGGTCGAGETIVVGAPQQYNIGKPMGSAHIFQDNAGTWTKCGTLEADGSVPAHHMGFGGSLFNLGDIDADGTYDELAVATSPSMGSSSFFGGGLVRIFGGSSGTQLKSLLIDDAKATGIGYFVGPAGDFNDDDVTELAIGMVKSSVNGVQDAGKVAIYAWSDINADETGSDGNPLVELTGVPKQRGYLGASYIPIIAGSDLSDKPISMLIGSPGYRLGDSCEFPPCGAATANAGGDSSPGAIFEFAFLKLAPSLPTRLTGTSSNAQMGATLAGADDIDSDGANDFIIGQPGGRCFGRPFGKISLYSVLDGVLAKDICTTKASDDIGGQIVYGPSDKTLTFYNNETGTGATGDIYSMSKASILGFPDIASFSADVAKALDAIASSQPYFSKAKRFEYSAGNFRDYFAVGDPEAATNFGNALVYSVQKTPASEVVTLTGELTFPGTVAEGFAASIDIMPDFEAAIGQFELLVSRVDKVVSGVKGVVEIYDKGNTATPKIQIPADNAAGGSTDALAGFGNFVLALPDFGNFDSIGVNYDADAYVFISNTNMQDGDDSATPEYFIFAVKDGGTPEFKLVKHEASNAGTMLGGYARLLPDINGDGIADLAISHPGGTGQTGQTGQVRIISGAGLTTTDTADDVLQTLYNPDANNSNFGVAVEYSDITGDGLADFVIGANKYDAANYQDAGAVYIFPMAPVK